MKTELSQDLKSRSDTNLSRAGIGLAIACVLAVVFMAACSRQGEPFRQAFQRRGGQAIGHHGFAREDPAAVGEGHPRHGAVLPQEA